MGPRLLVCISSAGASVALWRRGLVNCRRFSLDEAGEAEFAELLTTVHRVPVYFVVDTVEEDYRFETLPHTVGRDRREMIDRKLKQLYRNTPFASAQLQEREKDRRKDDRFLFMAVTDLEIIEPWVGAVMARGLPIAGVFPISAVTSAAVVPLKLRGPNLLIVSKHVAGLRQTFLKNGRFRFSRLTPFRGLSEDNLDSTFAAEIVNTRLYLNALQATSADEIVDVVLLDQDDSLQDLYRRVAENPGAMRAQRISRGQLGALLKIPPTAFDSTADALHLHLLGRASPKENLAPPDLLQGFRVHRVGRGLLAVAGSVAVVGVLWFAYDLNRVRTIEEDIASAAQQTRRYDALYSELTRQFPEAPVTAAALKQTVDAFDRLRLRARTPELLFSVVSAALEPNPLVSISSVTWKHGRFADLTTAFSPSSAQSGSQDSPMRQIGLIRGEIQPFTGDYRSAVNAIREFADQLRKHPRVVDAKIVKLPLDDSSKQSLTGTTSARAETSLGARFEISVLLREEGEGS